MTDTTPTPPPAPEVEAIRERDRAALADPYKLTQEEYDRRTLLAALDAQAAELARLNGSAPYALAREWEALYSSTYAKYRDMAERAEAAEQKSRAKDELHGIQLAAISTASIQNTESTIKERIGRDNPYWTVAYSDVCVAVDREMRERQRAEAAERELAKKSTPPAAPSELARHTLDCDMVRHPNCTRCSCAALTRREPILNEAREACGLPPLSGEQTREALTRREPEGLTEVVRKPNRHAMRLGYMTWLSSLGEDTEGTTPDFASFKAGVAWSIKDASLSHLSAQPGQTVVTNTEDNAND